ncbi:MAG: HAMP domain-containing sensor histidine kinase [bacterium]
MPEKDTLKPRIAEVVSITTHQLKTPISIVKGYLEALISEDCGKINSNQKEYLEDALQNLTRMSSLVNSLLAVSRIEEGRYKLDLQKFSLAEVTEDVVKNFSSWALASNSKIIFKSEKNLPLVISDPARIREVIENLISNSLKYKNPGEGLVEISVKREDDKLVFSCKDNGIGIPEGDKKKIFSKFYRSEKAVEADPSGTGLGLYINQAIINLSGGKIWFEKNQGPGTIVYFNLPISL